MSKKEFKNEFNLKLLYDGIYQLKKNLKKFNRWKVDLKVNFSKFDLKVNR